MVGAKGIIIIVDSIDNAMTPYGDYSDSTFLVFMVEGSKAKELLLPQSYLLASLSTDPDKNPGEKAVLELWVTALDSKSYELLTIWNQTLEEVTVFKDAIDWKPRYALWGCSSGLYSPYPDCKSDAQYIATCACGGQFCSP